MVLHSPEGVVANMEKAIIRLNIPNLLDWMLGITCKNDNGEKRNSVNQINQSEGTFLEWPADYTMCGTFRL